jgi:nitrilase
MMCQVLLLASIILAGSCNGFWTFLNDSVSGHLHTATPLSLPCFSIFNGQTVSPDPALCAQIQANYTSDTFRAQFYSGFMNNQDEMCESNATDQCLLDNLNPTNPLAFTNKSCNNGSVSQYYIDVHSVSDVVAALKLSRETGIRLSIKNSGHDYQGRSSLKGSLGLWMHNVGGISRNPYFIPEGCSASEFEAVNTITTGAGISSQEVYEFAESENVTFVGGYASTIGVSGGWVQGGGHSVLSPVLGLGIDRVVQFKIVTADGILRAANQCQHPDLFWALRGGGGGTFGVVMEVTHRVEPAMSLSVAVIQYNETAQNVKQWLQIIVDNGLGWANQGWGGHYVASNLICVTPLLNLSEATKSMSPAAEFARANNGTVVIETLPSWYAFYTKYVTSNEAAVGGPRILASRLIPASLFESVEGRAKLLTFMEHMLSVGLSPYIPATAPWLYPWDPESTSATPAWRSAIWELGMGVTWAWNSSITQREAGIQLQANLTAMIADVTPNGGSYMNEDSPWTADWETKWWGDNYEKLLGIKMKYDPEGLLKCWKCVGFEEDTAHEIFPCYTGLGS